MEFSEVYRCSVTPQCTPCFSPCGKWLATAVEHRLIIRGGEDLHVVQLYACLDRIDRLEWASNGIYVLCALYPRNIVQVWAVDDPGWQCKIDEGPAGISRTLWTPDGLGLVCVAEFQIRLTVWSLVDRKCTYLRGCKNVDKGIAFSPDGQTMAVLEREECKDHVTLYDTKSWSEVGHVTCGTSDAAGLAWSPDGSYLAVWDGCLSYKVQVFNADGAHAMTFTAPGYSKDALGVKDVAWNASGELLAVGSFDERMRILNHVTWQPLMECPHPRQVTAPQHVVVYSEVEEVGQQGSTPGKSPGKSPRGKEVKSKYIIKDLPASIPSVPPALDKPFPKLGVGQQQWSFDSQYLLTLNENMPTTVWIWDMAAMELSSVLSHSAPIKEAKWAPDSCTLALVAGNSKVYMWTPAGASIIHVPLRSFAAQSVRWAPSGRSFVLTDSEAFCCAYMV